MRCARVLLQPLRRLWGAPRHPAVLLQRARCAGPLRAGLLRDYRGGLKEFSLISGDIPMPPRFAFGVWYSRYWAYSDTGLMELVGEYETHSTPLDVLVTDMDFHLTFYKQADAGVRDQAGQQIGWTGFTWDPKLFPNPRKFLDWCKRRGLKNTINIHPASGVQPWEEKYAQMAQAMGIDPSTNKYVPFNITDTKFTANWRDIILRPMRDQGIDFFWLDWQQGEDWIDIPGVNPTMWLNYVFFTMFNGDATPNNGRRPMVFHRWGGLGNHRYPIGFSGDVVPTWDSLTFQPLFTATSSNVLYTYFSHDIGGHTAPSPPELYTRWVQWGIFSPIFRTHCTKNANNDRRIWTYPLENFKAMRDAIRLRAAMVPYIYTYARITFDSAVGIMRPMYYDYPEDVNAYNATGQFMFGDWLLVAPITTPVDAFSQLASKTVWFPPASATVAGLPAAQAFYNFQTGEEFAAGQTVVGEYELQEMAVFAKEGAIIPMQVDAALVGFGKAQAIPRALRLDVFPSATATHFDMYEDDGVGRDYASEGRSAWTRISQQLSSDGSSLSLTVSAPSHVRGGESGHAFDFLPAKRGYEVRIRNAWPARSVRVSGSPSDAPYVSTDGPEDGGDGWSYDGNSLTLIVFVSERDIGSGLSLSVTFDGDVTSPLLRGDFVRHVRRLTRAKEAIDNQWGVETVYMEDYPNLLLASEAGNRITYDPATAKTELAAFSSLMASARGELTALSMDASLKKTLVAQLSD
eukprot:Opistho-1_new@29725